MRTKPTREVIAPCEIDRPLFHRGRHEADLADQRRSYDYVYAHKKTLIAQHQNPVLYPGDFIRYVIELQNFPQINADGTERLPHEQPIDPMRFVSGLLGYRSGYLRGNIFNSYVNSGSFVLPKALQEKMAAITRTPIELWQRHNYFAADADGLVIDPALDISAVIEKHANVGGVRTKQLTRDALLDAHMKGL